MLSEKERKSLVERDGYTLGDVPCSVAGWANEDATVAPDTGGFYSVPWSEIKRAAEAGGRINPFEARWTSGLWLGTSR